jgi:hypothetical protein
LAHVVEKTLKGDADSLKERNIGVDLFHRDPSYDTNADPTVRVAAGEVRKKLAQYYFEPGNRDSLRIELPTGSYVPVFSVAEAAFNHGTAAAEEHEGSTTVEAHVDSGAAISVPGRRNRIAAAIAILLLAIVATIVAWRMFARGSAVDEFWAPIIKAPNPVLLCVGQYGYLYGSGSENATASVIAHGPVGNLSSELTTVILDDAITQSYIAGQLTLRNKPYSIMSESKTTYEDLQKGPAIILGAFNNQWAIRFSQSMRYRFEHNADQFQWIADRDNPSVVMGKQDLNLGVYGPVEYAIVARIIQPETKQPTIILGGVTPAGTLAAGNFITSPQLLGDFLKTAPKGWQSKNIEIVLSVNVIDNQPGPPHVAASAIW